MTWEERRKAICEFGFTERQAGFLVTVMLHSGVCFGRHYRTFAHIGSGNAVTEFFRGLLARGYASARRCKHPTARLYHIHHKSLYRAIGEPDNRNRRSTVLARAVERLLLLDTVVAERHRSWLATEREKVAHFTLGLGIRQTDLPARTYDGTESETTRYFPDKLPIALDADGRTHLFLFLVTERQPVSFRAFLERHAELFRSLPAWTVRVLVPWDRREAVPQYEDAFQQQLASPLSPSVLEDLRWYFGALSARRGNSDEQFHEAAYAFGAPRFKALYRAFLERGQSVLDATLSPTLKDAIARKTGQLECHVLPHRYGHLSSLVGTA
jgi:hypothetical protein